MRRGAAPAIAAAETNSTRTFETEHCVSKDAPVAWR
jgi:hypothetical protein